MKTSLAALATAVCLSLPSSAKAQESIPDTYHVEVLVHYIGYVSPGIGADYEGSATWRSGYSSTSLSEAQFVHDLFEAVLPTGGLEMLLGWDPGNWLIVDVRLRTQYAVRGTLMTLEDRPTLLQQYARRAFRPTPRYPSPRTSE